jgi:hypothetical protein
VAGLRSSLKLPLVGGRIDCVEIMFDVFSSAIIVNYVVKFNILTFLSFTSFLVVDTDYLL